MIELWGPPRPGMYWEALGIADETWRKHLTDDMLVMWDRDVAPNLSGNEMIRLFLAAHGEPVELMISFSSVLATPVWFIWSEVRVAWISKRCRWGNLSADEQKEISS